MAKGSNGRLVPSRKQTTHKLSGTKGGLSSPKRVPRPLLEQHSSQLQTTDVAYINKEGDEVGALVCPRVENPHLVFQKTGYSQSQPIPGQLNVMADKLSRLDQTIQTEWSLHSGLPSNMLPVAPAISGPVCHQVQQATTFCLSCSRPSSMGSVCTRPVLERSRPICLLTGSHLRQSGGEVAGLPLQQNHSDCTRSHCACPIC